MTNPSRHKLDRTEIEKAYLDLLWQRLSSAFWLCLGGAAFLTVIEIWSGTSLWRALLPPSVLSLGLAGLAASARRPRGEVHLLRTGLLGLMVCAATVSLAGVFMNPGGAVQILWIGLIVGSAAFFPWGPRLQTAAAAIVLGFYILSVGMGYPSTNPRAEAAALLLVGAASIAIASETQRAQRSAWRELAERRRRERSLRDKQLELEQQKAFLRQIIDINPQLVFAKDREGRFTLVNRTVAEIYGTSIDDLVGKTDADFNPHPEQVDHFRSDDVEVMDYLREKRIPEEVITDARGHIRWLETIKRPLVDASGRADQILGVSTDITERKRAESRLLEEAEIARTLASLGRETIGSLSGSDSLSHLCRIYTQALGCDYMQIWLRQPKNGVFSPVAHYGNSDEEWEALRVLSVPPQLVATVLGLGETQDIVVIPEENRHTFLSPVLDDINTDAMNLLVFLRGEGSILGVLCASYRRRAFAPSSREERIAVGIGQLATLALRYVEILKELERANRVKSEFVATMSHELRTPLNVIMGYKDLMLDGAGGPLTSDQSQWLERIGASAEELHTLVANTLDLSRLESGGMPVTLEPVALPTLLEEVTAEALAARAKPGVQLRAVLADELPPLRTDARKLKIILRNLVANALKFTEQGSVEIHARSDGGVMHIRVRDTGMGIDAEALPLVFDPFHQANAEIGARFGGAGLGLHIVRRLVDLLGGTVNVESQIGKGTSFHLRLPLAGSA